MVKQGKVKIALPLERREKTKAKPKATAKRGKVKFKATPKLERQEKVRAMLEDGPVLAATRAAAVGLMQRRSQIRQLKLSSTARGESQDDSTTRTGKEGTHQGEEGTQQGEEYTHQGEESSSEEN